MGENEVAVGNTKLMDAVGAKKTAKKLQELSDSMGDQAGAYTSQAKDAKSGLGKLAVDVGINAAQMGMDAVGGVFTGGNNLIPMAIRSFGGGAQEARQSGASTARQLAYGAGSAAVEVLTEKMFDGLAGVYGKGGADEIVEKAITRLTKNEAARRALTVAASAAGESIEEFASGIVNPALRTIYNGRSTPNWKQAISFTTCWSAASWARSAERWTLSQDRGGRARKHPRRRSA